MTSSPGDTSHSILGVAVRVLTPGHLRQALPSLANAHCGSDTCGILVRHAARAQHALH